MLWVKIKWALRKAIGWCWLIPGRRPSPTKMTNISTKCWPTHEAWTEGFRRSGLTRWKRFCSKRFGRRRLQKKTKERYCRDCWGFMTKATKAESSLKSFVKRWWVWGALLKRSRWRLCLNITIKTSRELLTSQNSPHSFPICLTRLEGRKYPKIRSPSRL